MTQISIFLVGVFAVTWALCILLRPIADQGGLTILLAWLLPTVWAPTIVALAVTFFSNGVAGLKLEVGRLRFAGCSGRWFTAGALFPPLATALAIWSARAAGDSSPFTPLSAIPVMVIIQLMTGVVGEELGWRSFLLPRIGKRFGAMAAAWLMTILWSLWHIAGFLFPGTPHHQLIPLVPFLLFSAFLIAVEISWSGISGSGILSGKLSRSLSNPPLLLPIQYSMSARGTSPVSAIYQVLMSRSLVQR